MSVSNPPKVPVSRLYAALVLFVACSFGLIARAVNLQVMETEFLQGQGEARFLREVDIPTTRGVISDRNGEPLAVSTPVDSVWVNPKEILQVPEQIDVLAQILEADGAEIERKLTQRSSASCGNCPITAVIRTAVVTTRSMMLPTTTNGGSGRIGRYGSHCVGP